MLYPTRNSANTLDSCLQSIVNQTYPNTELVIVDSQSTDRTIEIARELFQAATLSVVNEVKGIFGEAQIIITIYNNCKLMLLNISSHEILGLALERSFNCEDDNFIEKIKQLIAAEVNTKL